MTCSKVLSIYSHFLIPSHSRLGSAGVCKCPILGRLDITKNSSHEKDHIPIGWVMWKMGTFNDPCSTPILNAWVPHRSRRRLPRGVGCGAGLGRGGSDAGGMVWGSFVTVKWLMKIYVYTCMCIYVYIYVYVYIYIYIYMEYYPQLYIMGYNYYGCWLGIFFNGMMSTG